MLNENFRARRAEEGRVLYATIEEAVFSDFQTKVYADALICHTNTFGYDSNRTTIKYKY